MTQIKVQQAGVSALNIILSNIPVVGTAISEGLYDYWGRVKQERINAFAESLKQYFEKIADEEIDEQFLKSEDFAQFFELVLRKISEVNSEGKREIFKQIILGRIKSKSENDYSETFVNLVAGLHERQIEILKIVAEFSSEQEPEIVQMREVVAEITKTERLLVPKAGYADEEIINLKIKLGELQRTQAELKAKLDEIKRSKSEAYFNLFQKEFLDVSIQDLLSKGLLEWVTDKSDIFPQLLFLTPYGKRLLEFIKGS